jgi:hypothetical protein
MHSLFETRNQKFFYFIILFVLSFAFSVVRYFSGRDPDWLGLENSAFLGGILDGLISTLITSMVVTALWIFLSTDRFKTDNVRSIGSNDIKNFHREALKNTYRWDSVGHHANWVSRKVLPVLSKRTDSTNAKICIINPLNDELCKNYVVYRDFETQSNKDRALSIKDLKQELFTTIVAAYLFDHADNNRLDVEVYLTEFFNAPRIDSNDQWVMITHLNVENTESILIPKGTKWYGFWNTAISETQNQSRKISFSSETGEEGVCAVKQVNPAEIKGDDCKRILKSGFGSIETTNKVNLDQALDDETMGKIANSIQDIFKPRLP